MSKREFTVANAYRYNQAGPGRWIFSHLFRYSWISLAYLGCATIANLLYASISRVSGLAFDAVTQGIDAWALLTTISIALLVIGVVEGAFDFGAKMLSIFLSNRFARDAREELYSSLLGKSQTFHNRQRVGDIMARSTNDMTQLSDMVTPGFDLIYDSCINVCIVVIFIAILNWQLLLTPVFFLALFVIALIFYSRQLNPVSTKLRQQFGVTNAQLTESVTGIEVVKASAQEEQEKEKFFRNATLYRDYFVRNGQIQGRYLPTLILGIVLALAFLHGLFLYTNHQITLGTLIAFMGLMFNLRFITNISTWSFSLVQLGLAATRRILQLIKEETDLDENENGYKEEMQGKLIFDNVTFAYNDVPVLKNISFTANPGETIAIVGQTGSGKTTMTKLVNRIYDIQGGRVMIDGIDIREWNLDALRSQISTIEQDIFLFSRSVSDNIAYGLGHKADQEAIERASHDAQAHDFILNFKEGYQTEIGERGVTLSGGQRQRVAIARALLMNPRILILDDSTSAIDSATEDQIQQAIRRVLEGRTTLLITHRLSQIRWADKILVLKQGELIDQGTHEELLERSVTYRRIFSHHDKKQLEEPQQSELQEVE